MEQTYMTLPTAEQLGHRPHLLSDFAIALGAKCSERNYAINGQVGKVGEAWTCESSGTWDGIDFRPSQDYVRTVDFEGNDAQNYAGRQTVCIMPRIVNPEALGFDLIKSEKDNQEYVTLQGKPVTLPKTAITDAELEKRLYRAYRSIEGSVVRTGEHMVNGNDVAYYNEDVEPGLNSSCSKMAVERFEFEGKTYAFLPLARQGTERDSKFRDGTELLNGRWYFFECEPYQATREADGSIQFQEMVLPMQYETQGLYRENHVTNQKGELQNIADYNIGQYMNRALMKEMFLSVGLEYNQSQQQDTAREM